MKRIMRWAIVLAIVFFILLQAWHFFISIPIWRLQHVEIKGNLYWTQEDFLAKLTIPDKKSVFMIDLKQLEADVKKMVQVYDAQVYRKLPSTIVIDITERQPWAKIKIQDEAVVIDKYGTVLNMAGVPFLGLSRLVTIQGLSFKQDLPPFTNTFRESIEIIKKLFPDHRITIRLSGQFEIEGIINEHLRIIWGTEEAIAEKNKILKAILPVIQDKWNKVSYIDVRSPKNLAIKYNAR